MNDIQKTELIKAWWENRKSVYLKWETRWL